MNNTEHLPPLTPQQKRVIRNMRRWWSESGLYRYERTLQNERGEVRVEYVRTVPIGGGRIHESTGAVQIYPTGEEEVCGRKQGSRGVWKPSALREVPESEL